MHGAVRLVGERAGQKGVSICVDMRGDCPPVTADARAVRQILLNLLSNAVKFSRPRTTVTVRVHIGSRLLDLCVEDQGIGISRENLTRVNEPFFQVENELTRKEQGTGLGLPIVVSLAERMGAAFDLESEEKKGTRAILTLPLDR